VDGVLVVDRSGHVQLANDTARAMLHIAPEPAEMHYLDVFRHPEVTERLSEALAGRYPRPAEVTLDGHTIVAGTAPVSPSGGGGAVVLLHDISDLRRADRIRRDFVANVSHELRTPLTAIRGYTEALLDESPRDAAHARHFIEVIARHAQRWSGWSEICCGWHVSTRDRRRSSAVPVQSRASSTTWWVP
jgi:two-component system phosphate regulon sensor histidine kinase PhoR